MTDGRGLRPLGVLGALQFLTRVPIRLRAAPDLRRSVPWFPVVGAAIGAACGGVAAAGIELVPAPVAAAIAVLFGVLVTGAFHEDGLADMADAMGGAGPERRREILDDPRHGSYGVAALSGSIVLRIACVATLGPATAFGGLVAAHSLGRGAAVAVMGVGRPAASTGLGADYARELPKRAVVVGVVAALVLGTAVTGWWVLPLAGAAAIAAIAVTALAHRTLAGISGDVLGAVEQVAECSILVVVTGLAARHALWWQ